MPLPPNSIDPKWTLIRDHRIFFQRRDELYALDYSAPEEDYQTWLEAFHTLVGSFAFSEESPHAVLYDVVEIVPEHVREEPPGYQAEEGQSDGEPEHDQS